MDTKNKYSPPLISFDYAIKYLLKSRENYDILEDFISKILSIGQHNPIKISAILDPESTIESKIAKKSIADLIVKDTKGNQYIVEIARGYNPNFLHKSCFNTSRSIIDSINTSEDYRKIKKVFHITLIYDTLNDLAGSLYHGKTIFHDIDNDQSLDITLSESSLKSYKIFNIFPEYFIICIPNFQDKIHSELDEWLYVMKYEKIKQSFKSPLMSRVMDRLNVLKMDEDARMSYYKYKQEVITTQENLSTKFLQGKEKGLKQGMEKGKEEGLKQGKEEGKKEGLKQAAQNMLNLGLSTKQISQATGLSLKEIENIGQ